MNIEVIMPKWGLTMEEGTLVDWIVEKGDRVEKGQIIANVETDKVVNELEAPEAGIVSQILVPSGTDEVAIGTVLCIIEKAD
jgi:pyruvate/2-oxoglutarate dehydrogenase complex dihydrolipoamide acyltransferase (E2) component